ncbi:DUF3306 domain-containing protein [Pseudaestuariivita sp.]|uniref:DUF3306 domain-containing protein n=1 Tax=Pseudaestuariivita sp. TaxID=2211669 RepID=UPI004059DCF2
MSFWERRKAAVAAEEAAVVAEAKAAELEAIEAEKSDEELLEELGLPDPDTLEDEGDFKAFMGDAVPQRLKTRALRKLWRLNPVLANVDGLVDYGEDFTDAATVVENLQTAYQVGKGMLAHVEELARQSEAKTSEEAGEEIALQSDDDACGNHEPRPSLPPGGRTADVEHPSEVLPSDDLSQHIDVASAHPGSGAALTVEHDAPNFEDDLPAAPSRARRMTFTFDHEGAA